MKKLIIFIIIVATVSVIFLIFQKQKKTIPNFSPINNNIKGVNIANVVFEVELAQSSLEKAQGLAGREKLCPQCGMLFIYNQEKKYPFWMKETLIPLDIIWINKDKKIVDYIEYAQPQGARKAIDLPIYKPKEKAQYILEVPGGTIKKIKGFQKGGEVEFINDENKK